MADDIVLPPEPELNTQQSHSNTRTTNVNINAQMQMYLGPFPSPEVLERYEKISPGMTGRMMKMVESQAAHRLKLEKTAMDTHVVSQNRGQWFAFIMGMTSIIGGIGLLAIGKEAWGLVAIITPAISGVTAFGIGKFKAWKDLTEKKAAQEKFLHPPKPE